MAIVLFILAGVLLFLTALWGAWKNSAEGVQFPILVSLTAVAFFVGAGIYNGWEPWWIGIPVGLLVGPLAYWLGKVRNRHQSDWRLFTPTRRRSVTLVLIVFGTMAVAFLAWWAIGELLALLPIVAVLMPVEWIIVGFFIWRWRREDRERQPDVTR